MKKVFENWASNEEEFEKEFDDIYLDQFDKAKLKQKEYDQIKDSEVHLKKVKLEKKTRKNIFDRYAYYTIKDQLEIYKKLEEITFSTDRKNKETLKFLGDLLFGHIKEFCDKERLIDEEVIKMIAESNILDEEDKQEFDLEKKTAATKKTKADDDSREYRLFIQKKLYILLLKIRYEIVGFKMRLGMVFYKYLGEENSKHNLINKYLLYRIDQYINEPDEVEDDI